MSRKVVSYWQLPCLYLVSTTMDRSTEGGAGFGTFTLCNNNNNNIMKEILPQTRHTIHLYGDKHDLFFPHLKISILKYYECS